MPFGEAFATTFKIVVCALIGFAGGFWILSALFDRRISAREAVVLGLGLFVLMFFSVSLALHGGPGLLVLSAGVFGTALLLRGLGRYADHAITDRLNEVEIAKYRQAIENYPDNPHAHSLLADVHRRLGEHELAAKEYEAALQLDPSLREERYWLEQMRTEVERATQKGMSCPRCGAARPPQEAMCPECGRLYSTIETWRHALRVIEPWCKALWMGAGLGGLAAVIAVLSWAPGAMKLMSIAVFVVAPVFVIVLSARMRRRTG